MTFSIKRYGKSFAIKNIPNDITTKCFELIGKKEFADYISGYVNASIDMGVEYANKKFMKIIPSIALGSFALGWFGNDGIKLAKKKIEEKDNEN